MNEQELREAMDREHGPGAYDRMKMITRGEDVRIQALCEDLGYGRVMHSAEKLWREKVKNGTEHTVGPGAILLVPCICRLKGSPTNCNWCCGVGRVTERVMQAIVEDKTKKDVAYVQQTMRKQLKGTIGGKRKGKKR